MANISPMRRVATRSLAHGLARYTREQTNDGQDDIDFLIGIRRDPEIAAEHRVAAARELLNRGFGRSHQTIDVNQGDDPGAGLDLSLLSQAALDFIEQIMAAKQLGHSPSADQLMSLWNALQPPIEVPVIEDKREPEGAA